MAAAARSGIARRLRLEDILGQGADGSAILSASSLAGPQLRVATDTAEVAEILESRPGLEAQRRTLSGMNAQQTPDRSLRIDVPTEIVAAEVEAAGLACPAHNPAEPEGYAG